MLIFNFFRKVNNFEGLDIDQVEKIVNIVDYEVAHWNKKTGIILIQGVDLIRGEDLDRLIEYYFNKTIGLIIVFKSRPLISEKHPVFYLKSIFVKDSEDTTDIEIEGIKSGVFYEGTLFATLNS